MSTRSAPELGEPPAVEAAPGRFSEQPGVTVATRAVRGTLVNGAFLVAINALGLVKGLAAASLVSTKDYGLWGLIGAAVTMIWLLGDVGVDDKYVQQDHADQEAAFQVAFTLQCLLCALVALGILVGMPLFSLAYGQSAMAAPGMALALALPAIALQAPLWVYWRRMDFVRQRSLQAWEPVVSLVVTVALAAAGLGIWALAIGAIAGTWGAGLAAARAAPYPLGLRWEPGALREYVSFSVPLFVASGSVVLAGLVPTLTASHALGLAAVGAMALATNVALFANRVDEVITQALYPAICAVKDRADLLATSFVKSNRLALMWAIPCGVAVALFAGDLVHYVLGEKWRFATHLIEALALTAAANQIGFNWTAYFQAVGRTVPIAVGTFAMLVATAAVSVPLLVVMGVDGYAVGVAAGTVVFVLVRLAYLTQLFPALRVAAHITRSVLPTVPALAAVLIVRAAVGGGSNRPGGQVIGELVAFGAIALGGTWLSERALVRELVGHLRGQRPPSSASAASSPSLTL